MIIALQIVQMKNHVHKPAPAQDERLKAVLSQLRSASFLSNGFLKNVSVLSMHWTLMECYQAEVGSVQSRVCKLRSRKKTMYGKLDILPWMFVMHKVETLKSLIDVIFHTKWIYIIIIKRLFEVCQSRQLNGTTNEKIIILLLLLELVSSYSFSTLLTICIWS